MELVKDFNYYNYYMTNFLYIGGLNNIIIKLAQIFEKIYINTSHTLTIKTDIDFIISSNNVKVILDKYSDEQLQNLYTINDHIISFEYVYIQHALSLNKSVISHGRDIFNVIQINSPWTILPCLTVSELNEDKVWLMLLKLTGIPTDTMIIHDENNKKIDILVAERNEQLYAFHNIREDDVVLELGARYGSVSIVINSKLNNKKNQVSVEPDDRIWDVLEQNKKANNCEFNIIKGFISNKKLDLVEKDSYNGYGTYSVENNVTKIPSFHLSDLNMKFTVLVADCEGFLEMFFDENPDVYDNLRLITFEADYPNRCNYSKIRNNLREKGFKQLHEDDNINGFKDLWIKHNSS